MASTLDQTTYTPKKWNLSGLQGISDQTLQVHFGLYEGYVKNCNLLNEQISGVMEPGNAGGGNPKFSELTRRLGFEYNGMRLHEVYFDNMTSSGGANPNSKLADALGECYGGFDAWKKDFISVGSMRGVGWAIAFQDPRNGRITNHWVTLHEDGNVAGFTPIVVMDAWEHAFLLDYKPSERGKYIESFFANIDWGVAESRLRNPESGQ